LDPEYNLQSTAEALNVAKKAKITKPANPKRGATPRGASQPSQKLFLAHKALPAVDDAVAVTTVAVTFEWSPSGKSSWVNVDGQVLPHTPTTLPLAPGKHAMEWLLTGAPKTSYLVKVTGAKFPTDPITGTISDEGFDAGASDVAV
jgi:hypothetical protein